MLPYNFFASNLALGTQKLATPNSEQNPEENAKMLPLCTPGTSSIPQPTAINPFLTPPITTMKPDEQAKMFINLLSQPQSSTSITPSITSFTPQSIPITNLFSQIPSTTPSSSSSSITSSTPPQPMPIVSNFLSQLASSSSSISRSTPPQNLQFNPFLTPPSSGESSKNRAIGMGILPQTPIAWNNHASLKRKNPFQIAPSSDELQKMRSKMIPKKLKKEQKEKLRRDRINRSTVQLRNLLMEAVPNETYRSKLEKVDIYELAITYIRRLEEQVKEKRQDTKSLDNDPMPALLNQYGAAGYAAGCADASRYYAQLIFPTPQQTMPGFGLPFNPTTPPMGTQSFDQMMAGLTKANQQPQTHQTLSQQQPSTSGINNVADSSMSPQGSEIKPERQENEQESADEEKREICESEKNSDESDEGEEEEDDDGDGGDGGYGDDDDDDDNSDLEILMD